MASFTPVHGEGATCAASLLGSSETFRQELIDATSAAEFSRTRPVGGLLAHDAGAKLLPSLSPLTERSKLQLTPGVAAIGDALAATGYNDVSWDRGFQVTAANSKLSAHTYMLPAYHGVREKVPSFVAFSKKATSTMRKPAPSARTSEVSPLARPSTAPPQPPRPTTPMAKRTGGGGGATNTDTSAGGGGGSTSSAGASTSSAGGSMPVSHYATSYNTHFIKRSRLAGVSQSLDSMPLQNVKALSEPCTQVGTPHSRPSTAQPCGAAAVRRATAQPRTHTPLLAQRPATPQRATQTPADACDNGTRAAAVTSPAATNAASTDNEGVAEPAQPCAVPAQPWEGASRPGTALASPQANVVSFDSQTAGRPCSAVQPAWPALARRHRAHGVQPFTRRLVPHPMAGFRPSRAMALQVYREMDRDKDGRLILSEVENAAIAVGLPMETTHRLFDALDKDGKGYLVQNDWGSLEHRAAVDEFTVRYARKFMGLPSIVSSHEDCAQYTAVQRLKTVRTLPAAIKYVRLNATLMGSHTAGRGNDVIYDAFRFIDTNGSGELDRSELKDGFVAMGVDISDDVAEELMNLLDCDGNGTVEFHEFVDTLFPLAKGTSSML